MTLYHEVWPGGDVVLRMFIYWPGRREESAEVQDDFSDDGIPPPDHVRETVWIRVSSDRLSSCSPAFANLPKGETTSPEEPPEDDEIDLHLATELRLEDDDPTAMLLLMNIIHGQFDEVPKVDPNTLWELAILLDKYKFQSSHLKVCYGEWRQKGFDLKKGNITGALLHLCLCWLFDDEYLFPDFSKHLILESRGRITTDLPIPEDILDAIQQQRCDLLATIFDQPRVHLSIRKGERVPDEGRLCYQPECDTRVWYGMTRSLKTLGLYPFPESPYGGLSVNDTLQRMRIMPLPTLHSADGTIDRWLLDWRQAPSFHLGIDDGEVNKHVCTTTMNFDREFSSVVENSQGLWLHRFTDGE